MTNENIPPRIHVLAKPTGRVPSSARWPGKFPAGMVSNETMSHMDWLPTLLTYMILEALVAVPYAVWSKLKIQQEEIK